MKKKSNSDFEKHIKNALMKMTPDKAEEVWEQPVEKAFGNEWYLDGTNAVRKQSGKIVRMLSVAAACCIICFLSFYMTGMRVDATIYLDVNPSVELQINRNEKIVSAKAHNQDGEQILEGMELEHIDLDIGVNALLGSMVKHGYLSEAKNVILLSVDSKNIEKENYLRTYLTDEINTCLKNLIGSGMVLEQSVSVDAELEALAKEYGITPGKAAMLNKIKKKNPELDFAMLAALPMEELFEYLEQEEVRPESDTDTSDIEFDHEDEVNEVDEDEVDEDEVEETDGTQEENNGDNENEEEDAYSEEIEDVEVPDSEESFEGDDDEDE